MPQLPVTAAVSQLPGVNASQTAASPLGAEGGDVQESAQGLSFGAVLGKQLKGVAALLEMHESSKQLGLSAEDGEAGEHAADIAVSTVAQLDLSALSASMFPLASSAQHMLGGQEAAPQTEGQQLEATPLGPQQPEAATPLSAPLLDVQALGGQQLGVQQLGIQQSGVQQLWVQQSGAQQLGFQQSGAQQLVGQQNGVQQGRDQQLGSAVVSEGSQANSIGLAAEIAGNSKNLPQKLPREDAFANKLAGLVAGEGDNGVARPQLPDLSSAVRHPIAGQIDSVMVFRQPEQLPALPVAPRVGSAEWGGAVGEKVLWMANQNHQVAELHLNPPNLGPLEVRLTISNDQASALFVSHHSAVREAIETALPRLREMLADNGIMLGNASVGSESFSQQQQAFDQAASGREGGRGVRGADSGGVARVVGNAAPVSLMRNGMVDVFA